VREHKRLTKEVEQKYKRKSRLSNMRRKQGSQREHGITISRAAEIQL